MTDYIDQLTAMHMNVQKRHAGPHKAVMLLSVTRVGTVWGPDVFGRQTARGVRA